MDAMTGRWLSMASSAKSRIGWVELWRRDSRSWKIELRVTEIAGVVADEWKVSKMKHPNEKVEALRSQ